MASASVLTEVLITWLFILVAKCASQTQSAAPNLTASGVSRGALDPRLPTLHQLWAQREQALAKQRPSHENLPFTYLAICAVVKDEPRLLHEWLMYHHKVLKVQRFYVFDNNSTSTLLPSLLPLVRQGVLVYEYFTYTNGPFPQPYAMNQCMQRWGAHHEWMAFIDVDEFLVLRPPLPPPPPPPAAADIRKLQPRPKSPVEVLLSEYEGAGGLAVSWKLFNSQGYDVTPPGVLGYYNTCIDHDHIKTIANTHFWGHTSWNPHNHVYTAGAVTVDEDGQVVQSHLNKPSKVRRIALYHFSMRSRQQFALKMSRRDAWRGAGNKQNKFDETNGFIKAAHDQTRPQCDELHKFKDCFTPDSSIDCTQHMLR